MNILNNVTVKNSLANLKNIGLGLNIGLVAEYKVILKELEALTVEQAQKALGDIYAQIVRDCKENNPTISNPMGLDNVCKAIGQKFRDSLSSPLAEKLGFASFSTLKNEFVTLEQAAKAKAKKEAKKAEKLAAKNKDKEEKAQKEDEKQVILSPEQELNNIQIQLAILLNNKSVTMEQVQNMVINLATSIKPKLGDIIATAKPTNKSKKSKKSA